RSRPPLPRRRYTTSPGPRGVECYSGRHGSARADLLSMDDNRATPGDTALSLTAAGPVLFLCFFLSGASGRIYHVVWLRSLVHLFGATTLAVGPTLAAFMGGLAAGSWAAGRLGPRLPRPLAAYGAFELVIGLYALLLPGLLQGVVPTLRLIGATETSAYTAVSLGRFALAAALL